MYVVKSVEVGPSRDKKSYQQIDRVVRSAQDPNQEESMSSGTAGSGLPPAIAPPDSQQALFQSPPMRSARHSTRGNTNIHRRRKELSSNGGFDGHSLLDPLLIFLNRCRCDRSPSIGRRIKLEMGWANVPEHKLAKFPSNHAATKPTKAWFVASWGWLCLSIDHINSVPAVAVRVSNLNKPNNQASSKESNFRVLRNTQ